VRLAMVHAIDKKAIVEKLLRGYGTVIDTLQAPQYAAFDPSIKVKFDPEAAKKLLAAYDSCDHLHPSDAGYKAMAETIDLNLFR